MTFQESLEQIRETIREHGDKLTNEEMTKQALILPMIEAWGYDTRNPTEVMAEYGVKLPGGGNGRADYVIMRDGKPAIVIECKMAGVVLDANILEQMQDYVKLSSRHMEFLVRALDGESDNLSSPGLPPLPTKPDPALVRESIAFLRRTSLPIEARKRWPSGGLQHYGLSRRIDADLQAQPGRALCIWGDAGWGGMVRQGKYHDGHFADALVDACRKLIEEWNPQPAPNWVTCIPSRRHPDLVPDFSRRLAEALGLRFQLALIKMADRPEQKTMANSAQQARNLDGVLTTTEAALPEGPVLLVDDMVDSRWTFTIAAWLLRSCGSGEVWPLALAQVGGKL